MDASHLEGYVRYLASDELKGRQTPSPELDKAADFIAGEFKKAGLQPVAGSYFQEATYTLRSRGAATPATPPTPAKVRNVIAVLPGSDPVLGQTYVVLSSHYDHLGMKAQGEGDLIFNGANDNASGTAGVMELASVLKNSHPKRSILFICFYGEEKGLVGSRYFVKNPLVPLKQIDANVNLEQIGRVDGDGGTKKDMFNLTGFGFTDMATYLAQGCNAAGIKEIEDKQFGDPYFRASDNAAFAAAGVPAHTISVTYEFPDYHAVGDEWSKLDYANMAKVVKAIGLGTLAIANSANAVKWDESNPKTARFVEAWKKLQGSS